MNIVLISMGVVDFDGRLLALYNLFNKIGQCSLISYSKTDDFLKATNSKSLYFINFLKLFFYLLVKYNSVLRKSDYILIDNYYTSIFGVFLNFIFKKKIIYDMRELYCKDLSEYKFFTRYLILSERYLMKNSEIIIVANIERKNYVINNYLNVKNVVVYENVRFLPQPKDNYIIDEELKSLVSKYACCVVSTGGYSTARGTDKLVREFSNLSDDFGLFIIGGGISEYQNQHQHYNDSNNIHFLPKVPYHFLSEILVLMDIGVVHYSFDDINNRLCASGKVFEYIGLGLPIVTTEHESLIRFCYESECGISDNTFHKGIKAVYDNLSSYSLNALSYSQKPEIVNYDEMVSKEIKSLMDDKL